MKKSNKIYVVDLFCGMGGFSCGASYAGAKVVLAIDSWEPALLVHELNHPDCAHIQMELGGDLSTVCNLIKKYIPKGSKWHLHGSPPCQMLSRANRNTNNVNGGMYLVDWFLDLVDECRPDSWSMEQVQMALKYLNSYDFDNCEILNAKDFGVPQTRKRLFIGDGWSLPSNLKTSGNSKSGERGVIDVLPHLAKEGTHIKGYSNTRPVIIGGEHVGNRKMSSLEGLMPLEVATFTLCASGPLHLYKLSRNKTYAEKVRNLTVPECLTIQGFPGSYKTSTQSEPLSERTQYKLIGNSVCPVIAYQIIKSIDQ